MRSKSSFLREVVRWAQCLVCPPHDAGCSYGSAFSSLTGPPISVQGSPTEFVFCKGLGDIQISMSLEGLSKEVHSKSHNEGVSLHV